MADETNIPSAEPAQAAPTAVAAPAAPAATQSYNDRPAGRGGQRGDGRHQQRGGGGGRRRDQRDSDDRGDGLSEKTIFINRSSKVVKGGRRFSFSALIVAGDRQGRVGLGLGKGGEVSDAIRKGSDNAKSRLIHVALRDSTIPHAVTSHFGGAKVLLRPASPGTGLICGKTVRAVVESAGVKDILSKSLGSKNAANVAKATLKALLQLRRREDIFKARGIESRLQKAA